MEPRTGPSRESRIKSSLLWGLVGLLSYFVFVQAYHLLTETFLDVQRLVLVALLVGVVTTVLTYLVRPRLRAFVRRREE